MQLWIMTRRSVHDIDFGLVGLFFFLNFSENVVALEATEEKMAKQKCKIWEYLS